MLLVLLGALRFALIDRGAWSLPDEFRYYRSFLALSALGENDLRGFFREISSTEGRPGYAALMLVPMAVQKFFYDSSGLDPTSPRSLLAAQSFNVLVSLALACCFFRLSMVLLGGNRAAALTGTLLYSLLANSNVYIRHALPYDMALLFFMCALCTAMRAGRSLGSAALAGVLTGIAVTVYPGYYFAAAVVLVAAVLSTHGGASSFPAVRSALVFGVSTALPLSIFEVLSRFGGASYISDLLGVSSTITQGSFEEGFSFLPKYMAEVEGAAGVLLLVLAVLYLLKSLVRAMRDRAGLFDDRMAALSFVMAAGFLFHASSSAIFHKMVFYGRLLHMYMPFLVLASVALVAGIKSGRPRRAAYGLVLAASLYSFYSFYSEYRGVEYPRDVLYRTGVRTEALDPAFRVSEVDNCNLVESPPADSQETGAPHIGRGFVLVNFCYPYPVKAFYGPFEPPFGAAPIFSAPHFIGFPAYLYEGFSSEERGLLNESGLKLAIYRLE